MVVWCSSFTSGDKIHLNIRRIHEPLPTVLCRPEACCCVLATVRHVAALLSMAWLVCPAQISELPEPLLSLAGAETLAMRATHATRAAANRTVPP